MKYLKNDILSGKAFENCTEEQKNEILCEIIEKETQKTVEERDEELISICLDLISKEKAQALPYSEEELQKRLSRLKKASATEHKATFYPRKRKLIKTALVLAACLILLFSTLSVAAATMGYSSVLEFITRINKAQKQEEPSLSEGQSVWFIEGESKLSYQSAEALLIAQEADILYPSKLNNTLRIQSITREMTDGKTIYVFQFTGSDLTLLVSDTPFALSEMPENYSIYQTESGEYRFIKQEDGSGYAVAVINGYEYQFLHKDYRSLFLIFDHMVFPADETD